jgi:putative membrane protein
MMAGASVLAIPDKPFGSGSVLVRSLLGGMLAATVDLAMEPVLAGPLRYWRWIEPGPLPGGAPLANYLGWWGTATLAGIVLAARAPKLGTRTPRWVLVGFLTLIVGLGLIS